jgi:hypothetical protein
MALQRDLETFAREQRLSTSTLDVAELLDELFPLPPEVPKPALPPGMPPLPDQAALGTRMLSPSRAHSVPPLPAPPVLPDGAMVPVPGARARAPQRRDDEPSFMVVDYIDDAVPMADLEQAGVTDEAFAAAVLGSEPAVEPAAASEDYVHDGRTVSRPSRSGVRALARASSPLPLPRAPSMTAALPGPASARAPTESTRAGVSWQLVAVAIALLAGGAVVGMLIMQRGKAATVPAVAPAPVAPAPAAAAPAPTPAPVAPTPTPTPAPAPTAAAEPAPTPAPAPTELAPPSPAPEPEKRRHKRNSSGANNPSTPAHGPNWDPDSPELPGL